MACQTALKSSRPNGWLLRLIQDGEWFTVRSGDDDEYDFETLAEAEACYEEERAALASTPNWEMQAAYDEAYGEPLYLQREE